MQILTEPKNALVKQYQKLMEYDQVALEFQPEALKAAADRALERGIGARGLRAVLEESMTELMYEIPSDPAITKVTITEKSVRGEGKPLIERDEERLKRPPARLGAKTVQEMQRRKYRGDAS